MDTSDPTRFAQHIVTEIGLPMMYRAGDGEPPFKPTDATHVGPAGDYWRMELDDIERKAHGHVWTGTHWEAQDHMLMHGLVDLGLTFKSICDMPDMSMGHMLARAQMALLRDDVPEELKDHLKAVLHRYTAPLN